MINQAPQPGEEGGREVKTCGVGWGRMESGRVGLESGVSRMVESDRVEGSQYQSGVEELEG